MEKNFLGKGDGVNNLASQALVSGAIFSSPWETLSGAKQTPRQIWQRVKNRGHFFHSTGNIARRPNFFFFFLSEPKCDVNRGRVRMRECVKCFERGAGYEQ